MESELTIEKGIPIPEDTPRRSSPDRIPFTRMEVGDSVLVPLPADADATTVTRERMRIYAFARSVVNRKNDGLPRLRISLRRVDGGFRVWRVQ